MQLWIVPGLFYSCVNVFAFGLFNEFLESVSVFCVCFLVFWCWVLEPCFVQLVLFVDESFEFVCAPQFFLWFGCLFEFRNLL